MATTIERARDQTLLADFCNRYEIRAHRRRIENPSGTVFDAIPSPSKAEAASTGFRRLAPRERLLAGC
jgi:hypothetical protein